MELRKGSLLHDRPGVIGQQFIQFPIGLLIVLGQFQLICAGWIRVVSVVGVSAWHLEWPLHRQSQKGMHAPQQCLWVAFQLIIRQNQDALAIKELKPLAQPVRVDANLIDVDVPF